MDLFSLVAKLTLDSKEYDRALNEAESKGAHIHDIEATLDLDTEPFEKAVAEAEGADVSDPEKPELGLDSKKFYSEIETAEGKTVDDPDKPELGLDSDKFYSEVERAEGENVDDPEQPELDLDTDKFYSEIETAESETVNDPETPSLDLDNSGFTQGLSDSLNIADTFSLDLTKIFDFVKQNIAISASALGITTVVNTLSEAVDLARSLGDNVDKQSRAMSLSTDAYQEWSHVLDINGASITDLNRGLMNMRKLIGGGEVSKEASAAFDRLGLSAKVASGEISGTEDLLKEAVKALADFDTSTEEKLAERDYLAQSIFGRGGTKLNAMFDGTSQDIDDLINQAHELGLVMTEEEVANAADYNDSLTNMNASVQAFKTAIVQDVLPGLTDVYNKLAALVAFFNPRTRENGLSQQLDNADDEFSATLSTIEGTGAAAMNIVDKLMKMGDAEKLTAEQTAEWRANADWLITNIPELSDVVDKDTLKLTANKEEIEAIIKKWQTLSKERALANAKEAKYSAIVAANQKAIDKQVEARQKENEALKAGYAMVDKVNELFAMRGSDQRLEYTQEGIEEAYRQGSGANINRFSAEEQEWAAQFEPFSKEWSKNTTEAKYLREEAKSLAEEAAKADEDFQAWSEAADELFASVGDGAESSETSLESAKGEASEYAETLKDIPSDVYTEAHFGVDAPEGIASHAKGSDYVPYDNYPALLHRGEAVLTASEARRYREGSGGGMDISGLQSAIISAIREGIRNAEVPVYMDGKLMNDQMNKRTADALNSRRYAP